jgi:ABC-type iron transport system FetAB ATPase subunit
MATLTLQGLHSPYFAAIDLELAAEACVAISGISGSGKTRLLRAIADLDPHEGEIRLDGKRQQEYTPSQWRGRVAYLPTESHWWELRVGDHFQQVDHALLHRLGFDETCLEWELSHLSSGERQRLALARLLAGKPQVLLLDEPTANLDQENGARVEELLLEYRRQQGATLLWVTHNPEQKRRVGDRGLSATESGWEVETWN